MTELESDKALIELCCTLSMKAHCLPASPDSPCYISQTLQRPLPCAVFAFPGSWSADDWIASGESASPFGESAVDLSLFPSLKRIGDDTPALVNAGFLRSLRRLLGETPFEAEVHQALSEKKRIVFTGHSSGGAVSVLSTIWLLEQLLKSNNYCKALPSCITFGAPLVGDGILIHAAKREDWNFLFLNFITKRDLVPRVLLLPLSHLKADFQAFLNSILAKSLNSTRKFQHVKLFYNTVLKNAISLSSKQACLSMGCTNPLVGALSSFMKLSPYRPLGVYIFYTSDGQLVGAKNSDVVLQLFFLFLQYTSGQDATDIACNSLEEHLQYETRVKGFSELQHVFFIDSLEAFATTLDDDGYSPTKDLDLGMEARLSLSAATELEMQKLKNQARIDANYGKIQESVNFLSKYRTTCEIRGLGYYDTFKLQKEKADFDANVRRLELAGLWDEIIEMLRRQELPDSFEGREEWVTLGTSYRLLVEPLDIANYYRHSKNEDTGPYMIKGRPKRYRYTQRWLEYAQKLAAGFSSESCFWAKVEELCMESSEKKSSEKMKISILDLEDDLVRWLNTGKLGKDVLLDGSTFMRWWQTLPEEHKVESCITRILIAEGKVDNVP